MPAVRDELEALRDEIRGLRSVVGTLSRQIARSRSTAPRLVGKAEAARLLGIDRKTLYRKLEEYGRGEEVRSASENAT